MPTLSSIIAPNNIVTAENELTLTNKTIDSPVITVNGQPGNPRQPLVFDGNGGVTFGNSDSFSIPAGGTGERPGNPETGELRFNTDEGSLEQYDGTEWISVGKTDQEVRDLLSAGGDLTYDSATGVFSITFANNDFVAQSIETTGALIENAETITSSSNAATLDLSAATNFTHTLTEDVTYTFGNPAASGKASAFTLKIVQDSTARTITWPASVEWADATAPTLSNGAGDVDYFVFITTDGGTTYYGFTAGQALATPA